MECSRLKRFAILGVFATLQIAMTSIASAKDLGFRYQNNTCANSEGKTGLNPGFFGQCGDLRNVTIAGLNLDDTDLSGAVMDGSDFQNSSFVGSKFMGTSFVGTNLSGATLTSAIVVDANFSKAILINTHFAGAEIHSSNFSDSDLSGQNFSTMSLTGNFFVGTNFTGAKLDNSDLSNCDLSRAKLAKVNMQGAKLDGAKINRANFSAADLTSASLKNVTGVGVNLASALLRQAVLDGSSFVSGNFQSAKLDKASLKKVDLRGVNLRRAILKDANIEGGSFAGAVITKSTVLPISLDEALALGMSLDSKGSVLIIYDQTSVIPDFLAALSKLEVSYTLASRTANFDGTMDLSEFSAILHLNIQTDYNAEMPDAGQDAIINFVKNGGVFISTSSTNYAYQQGRLRKLKDVLLFQFSNYTPGGIMLKPLVASHPLMADFAAETSYSENYSPTATLIDFATNKSVLLMADNTNSPRVAVRDIDRGHAVGINLCFRATAGECLIAPAFQKLVANAVFWNSSRRVKKN